MAEPDGAVAPTRLFTEALNARDLPSLRALVADEVEFPSREGKSLRGLDGLEDVVRAAANADLLLAREGSEAVNHDSGTVRVSVPMRQLVRKSELHVTAEFQVTGDSIARFDIVPAD
jgi:SnoaL-like domain